MCIFKAIKEKREKRNRECSSLLSEMNAFSRKINAAVSYGSNYISRKTVSDWQKKGDELLLKFDKGVNVYKKASLFSPLRKKRISLGGEIRELPQKRSLHNIAALEKKVKEAYALIPLVEGRALDKQQMEAIVKEEYNHLIIAGAGTGKTTTIVGKIKYLLKTRSCRPEDILVLSFTNASAAEMRKRILDETGKSIETSTFHKLGVNIITAVNNIMPKISKLNMRAFVGEQLEICLKNVAYLEQLNSHFLFERNSDFVETANKTKKDHEAQIKANPPVTLKDEKVKSYGEAEIADFLFLQGIPYVYEGEYEIDTRTKEYGQYYPDFYLPEQGIYIEYFGIDRNGEVPSFFTSSEGNNAKKRYLDAMEWKRALHKEHGTKLIECFAYERVEGTLLEGLKRALEEAGVSFSPLSVKEIWEKCVNVTGKATEGLVELFETLINLIKSNGYDIETLRRKNNAGAKNKKIDRTLSLLAPIYNAYEAHLKESGEIDFNDMINLAANYVRSGKYKNKYRYVIVDEYQDISKARFNLLRCLRETGDYDLFCVGDDWQSIYRFAGSDIDLFVDFEKYWGETEISKIETSYRFSQKLIDISGGFIMKNPRQIKKSIVGQTKYAYYPLAILKGVSERRAVYDAVEDLMVLPEGSTVFFIGRYTFDINILKGYFSARYDIGTGVTELFFDERPDLKITFLTAHKSKGLQADYVFIVNNKFGELGFPSNIQEDPTLGLLLDNSDSYPHGEERRLFYVAMTRAKKKVYLLTVDGNESVFVEELLKEHESEIKKASRICPLCGARLVKRSGRYGFFYGCSNYKNGCRYTSEIPI